MTGLHGVDGFHVGVCQFEVEDVVIFRNKHIVKTFFRLTGNNSGSGVTVSESADSSFCIVKLQAAIQVFRIKMTCFRWLRLESAEYVPLTQSELL